MVAMAEVPAAPTVPAGGVRVPRVALIAIFVGCVATPVVMLVPLPAIAGGLVALALATAVFLHPPLAAYTLITLTPLLAGLERGSLIPVLRPHEALVAVVGSALLLNGVARTLAGGITRPRLRAVDTAIVLMAVTGSVVPLLWLVARGRTPTSDDFLYALTFWKLYAVFVVIRLSVRRGVEVRRCLWLSMVGGCVVAVVAALQSLQLFGVAELMDEIYPPSESGGGAVGRGTATVGSSHAVGDIMAFNLAIAVGWLLRGPRAPRTLIPVAILLLLGGLASGQFSGAIALAVSVATVGALTGRLGRLTLLVLPAAVLGAVLLWPVIELRLTGFDSTTGLPQSWDVRLENLRTYFWPELFTSHSYLLGVRPAARIAGPDLTEWIYIESGYTWLLWVGGLPLLAAYLVFVSVATRQGLRVARTQVDGQAAVGIAAVAALACTVVLMAFDPHLVMRGAGDLLFTLLGLTAALARPTRSVQSAVPSGSTASADRAPVIVENR